MSTISVTKTSLNEILPLRNLFFQENNFQIRYNACHDRGWTDSYIVMPDNAASKATLIKAGMRIAGFMLLGQVFIINK